jgi:hypothetical protein
VASESLGALGEGYAAPRPAVNLQAIGIAER